ncbi:hypothetical protein SAMN04487950_2856 [Halogranum rubrum]|uniref:Uncharacterized protein n=1 Tax=Halogranum rubrum TaxID=553466 RepID=A0A1I4FV50_9EURY|nr:hypothetical protein [Halogranum rubrum]SFL21714.1 hypothetical protein SAMN04487950_2856 [Halogranum rubrum]
MTDQEGKLSDLLVDEEELNEELLFEILSDYIRIGSESGNLVTQPAFRDLDSKQKVLVVLLARKACTALNLADSEWMTPTEISGESGVKKGTVYPTVRKLAEDLNIAESDDGNYCIPTHNLDKARSLIRGDYQ